MSWDWIKHNALTLINLVGSVASIVGFAILLLTIAASDNARPPEVVVWQYVFFFMCLILISSSIVFTWFWIVEGLAGARYQKATKVAVVTIKLCLGMLMIGAGLDGLVSAIHWTIWFALPLNILGKL